MKRKIIYLVSIIVIIIVCMIVWISYVNIKNANSREVSQMNTLENTELSIVSESSEEVLNEIEMVNQQEQLEEQEVQEEKITEVDPKKTKTETQDYTTSGQQTSISTEIESPTTSPTEASNKQDEKVEEVVEVEKTKYDYEFDVNAIKSELIALGTSMGLKHITTDDGVTITPQTHSWSSPVTASSNFQGKQLENKLKDYVRTMPSIVGNYGGTKLEYFTIYVENLGNGSYKFYFLY